MRTKIFLTTLSVVLGFLSACTQMQPSASDNILNVKVIAADTKTPLSIHFFTLKSPEVFKKLDYFELVSSKRINWNNELVSRAKTLLTPGSSEIFQVQLTNDIQYYALVIGFKDVEDNDNWRYLRPVNTNGDNSIALKLSQVDGYTSKAVKKIKEKTKELDTKNNKIIQIGDKVESSVNNRANQVINNKIDNVVGRIFK